jgi:hypothetical protein
LDTVLQVSNGFIDQNVIFERFRCKVAGEMREEPNIPPVEFYRVDEQFAEDFINGKDGK